MQTDPLYVNESKPHGSWFGAVELMDQNVFLLGSLGMETHVRLDRDFLEGFSESGMKDWLVACGEENEVFDVYRQLLQDRFGMIERKPSPRVWCSWYSFYNNINEVTLNRLLEQLAEYPFDVIQVDDGWEQKVGDWQANPRFSSGMQALADNIHSKAKRAGLWLAPLLAVQSSKLFHQHPHWFLKDQHGNWVSAGHNFGERLYALDTTHPEVLEWLKKLMKQVRKWGYDYVKLDFLYAAALPGKHYEEMPREMAYRQGMKTIREALGEDLYLLACGAPIFPSLGLCDALRIGPDVSGKWENYRDSVILTNPAIPGARNAIRTTLHRLWLNPLVQVDPDVVYFSPKGNDLNAEQREYLQDLALICNFRATSDIPEWFTPEERQFVKTFLTNKANIQRKGRYTFLVNGKWVDFSDAIPLPSPLTGIRGLGRKFFCWLADHEWALKLSDWASQRARRGLGKS